MAGQGSANWDPLHRHTYTVWFNPRPKPLWMREATLQTMPRQDLLASGSNLGSDQVYPTFSTHTWGKSLFCGGSFGSHLSSSSLPHSPHVPWKGSRTREVSHCLPHWTALAQPQRTAKLSTDVRMLVTSIWPAGLQMASFCDAAVVTLSQQLTLSQDGSSLGEVSWFPGHCAADQTSATSQRDCGVSFIKLTGP